MPGRDGTGPFGIGPGTGRRRGSCRSGRRFDGAGRMMPHNRGGWFFGAAAPLAVAAIRDLVNPRGLLRNILREALGYVRRKSRRTVIDAQYSVLDEQPGDVASEQLPDAKEKFRADT